MKRLLAIGDLHCGHFVGLTPPDWWLSAKSDVGKVQRALWSDFKQKVKTVGKVHALLVNGDAIDGDGKRSGGCELITSDRNEQCEMAIECIKQIKANHYYFTFGTPYHTGNAEEFERIIAKEFGGNIKDCQFISVDGVVFNARHFISGSATPYGRHTAIAKEKTWADIWREMETQPKSDVIIRSHVHYTALSGSNKYLGITLPALQGLGSRYGGQKCTGTVHYGMVYFDVNYKDGDWPRPRYLVSNIKEQRAKVSYI